MNLKDKHVLVTGASRGVGRAISLAAANEGATVFLLARDEDTLRKLENDINEQGGKAASYAVDVTVENEVVDTIDSIIKTYGTIDVLVNNVGRGHWDLIVDMSVDTWTSVMDINMKSTFLMCKYVLPHMYERKEGHVVNISSTQAFDAIGHASAYCASKAAMEAFTQSLQQETKSYGVKATSVAPSTVDTGFRDEITNRKPFTQEEKDNMLTPKDVAEAVIGVLKSSPRSAPRSVVLDMHKQ